MLNFRWKSSRRNVLIGALLCQPFCVDAQDGPFDFAAPPSTKHNAIWRVDRQTGEVGYCFFRVLKEGTAGETICAKAGAGAGPQKETGPYRLIASRVETEPGIFRVNERSGAMSLCYPRANNMGGTEIGCTELAR